MPRVGYTGDLFAFVVEGRSSYSVGDARYTAAAAGRNLAENDGPLQLQMAYVLIGNPKEFPVTAKVGRQELTYGDQRLLGNAFWLNIPHTFDAVKVRYQGSSFGVDLFAARLVYVEADHFEEANPQDMLSGAYFDFPGFSKDNVTELYRSEADHFEEANPQDMLSGAYFDFPGFSKDNVTELYLFARNVARGIVTDNWSLVPAPFRFTAPQDIYTLGYHMKSKPGALGPWDYGIEAMWQFGDRTAVFPATTVAAAKGAPRLDQSAWAFVAQGGYTWKGEPWTPRLALIVSCASGDQNSKDRDSQTFQNLLPSNHGLYGMMDLSSLQNI